MLPEGVASGPVARWGWLADIVFHIERGNLLDILEHPNPERYGGQRIFVVRREDYVYPVPYVENDRTKATKEYLGEESDHED